MNNMWGMNGFPMMGIPMYNMQKEYELAQLKQMKAAREQVEATKKKLDALATEVDNLDKKIRTPGVSKENYDTGREKRLLEEQEKKQKQLKSYYNGVSSGFRGLYITITVLSIIASVIIAWILCPGHFDSFLIDSPGFSTVVIKVCALIALVVVEIIVALVFYGIADAIFADKID